MTASMSRCALNYNTNCATQLCGLVATILMILATVFLSPYFVYVPCAALAGIIIVSCGSLFRNYLKFYFYFLLNGNRLSMKLF